MVIRVGQYVSGEGRIYHPFLANWREDVSVSTPTASYENLCRSATKKRGEIEMQAS